MLNLSPAFISREINHQRKPWIANYEEFIKICWSSKQKHQFLTGQGSSSDGSCFASSSSLSPEPVYFSARAVGRWIESHQITSLVFYAGNPCPGYAIFLAQNGMRSWISNQAMLALEDKTCNALFTSLLRFAKSQLSFALGFAVSQFRSSQRSEAWCGEEGEHHSSCPENRSDHLWYKKEWMQILVEPDMGKTNQSLF